MRRHGAHLPVRGALGVALLTTAASSGAACAQAVLPPFLELRVPKPPTVAAGDGESVLVYELHVTNFAAQPVTVLRVEVAASEGGGPLLLTLADSVLARSIMQPGTDLSVAERVRLGSGMRAVVHLWVPAGDGTPPSSVRNRVAIQQEVGDSLRVQELEGPAVAVSRAATPIGPPLRGGVWLAANGPSNESGHRRALIPIQGTPSIAQRFAIDYVRVDDDHRTFAGDSLKNESYYAEDADVLAVAGGTVVAMREGIPENIPGPTSRAVPITLETVGGNHVIIDIGEGRYAFYAHLKPGSVRVRLGEHVHRGQVIGLVGNSGNSTEPHLHFHISDGPSPLGSEGLPYGHDAFEIVGRCRGFNQGCERTVPQVRRGELPLANVLVRFPD